MLSTSITGCLRGAGFIRPFAHSLSLRMFSGSLGLRNDLDELKNPPQNFHANRNATTYFDIDSLIAKSPGLQEKAALNDKFDNFTFGSSLRNPREVAKSINMFGPLAGRSVDVRDSFGVSSLRLKNILKKDKIREFQQIQSRFIRPAKLRKMKKAFWWKQNFREKFHALMIDIKDAKRRGY